VLLILSCILITFPAYAQDASKDAATAQAVDAAAQQLRADTGNAVQVNKSPVTGVANFVRLAENANLATVQREGNAPEAQAASFFRSYGAVFGIRDANAELRLVKTQTDGTGAKHLVYQQVYQGVEIFAGQLRVHFNKGGRLTAVNGAFVPNLNLNTTPRLSAQEAANAAVQMVLNQKQLRDVSTDVGAVNNHLYIYRTGLARRVPGNNHLVYAVEVTNAARSVREFVFIDAQTGKAVDQYSGVHQIDRQTYNGGFGPGFLVWSEGDPQPFVGPDEAGINDLINFAEDTYNLYATMSNGTYISWDGADGTMHSVLNDPTINCPNANWNGVSTNYCNDVSGDDTVAHEWAHAYTERTHNLIYAWQPGALNESYSDIFGEVVDLLNGAGLDTPGGLRTANACSVFQTSLPAVLTVNAPIGVAGVYTAAGAAFGPPLTAGGLTGDVVLANDGTGSGTPPDPSLNDACEPLTNAADISGKIALVDRGACDFTVKVKNAQDAGAIGVIVANHVIGGDGVFTMSGVDPTITIPALMIGYSDGNLVKSELAAGVNATLQTDPNAPPPDNSYRWLSGEDDPAFGGAIRDMWAPNCFGHPGKVSDAQYFCTEDDGGGVHSNSGVPNHAFALLVDGGDYNNQTITGIGLTKAAHIFWRAESVYQGPATGFPEHADALEASCSDLVAAGGVLPGLSTDSPTPFASAETMTAADCVELAKVIAAVEYRTEPTQCGFTPLLDPAAPALCLDAGTVETIAVTTWETGLEGWTPGQRELADPATFDGTDWTVVGSLPDGRAGSAAFVDNLAVGNCVDDTEAGVRFLESPIITIPAGSEVSRIAFDHWMASEPEWDGGNVKLSINGGPWRIVPAFAFEFNPYNRSLIVSDNPLGGERAFSGTNGGSVDGSWGQSQINLAGLVNPGDTVQLRMEFGQDGCNGISGWYVDGVQVYSCSAEVAPPPPPAQPLACNTTVSFNGGVPADWAVIDNAGNGVVWTDVFGSGELDNYTGGPGNAASVSSDAAGLAEFDTELRSNPFDLTGFSIAELVYLANYQNLEFQDFLDLDISNDGGATWTTLLSWNEDHGAFRSTNFIEQASVDLSAYAGQSGLLLRWHYYDPNNRDFDWYAQVDEVGLFCATVPTIAVSPTELSATLETDTSVQQTLTITNTGTGTLTWSIYEGQTPAVNLPALIKKPGIQPSRPERLRSAKVVAPTASGQAAAPTVSLANAVQDGSFEAGSPSPVWEESSTNFGTPLCDLGCGAGGGTGPLTGDWWAWLGGFPIGYEASALTQTVTIPAGATALTFYLEQPNCDSAADYLAVLLDGQEVFRADGSSPACGTIGYALQTIDVSVYADGAAHTLAFHSETFATNGTPTNFFVDDVSIAPPSACDTPTEIAWLDATPISGTTTSGAASTVNVTLDATGLSGGVYAASLCVESNDPTTPVVEVPVSITVSGPPAADIVYLSSSSSGQVDGTSFRDEDILAYNPATNTWWVYFDGSNLGPNVARNDVDAFEVLPDGDLLISFEKALTVNGLEIDDSDIVRFTGDSYGLNNTVGSFSLYFDGSEHGLTESGEDVDAIAFAPNGNLVISTLGKFEDNPPGISGRDEDLFELSGDTWSLYFQGKNNGMGSDNEDIWGAWIDADSGAIHLSTIGNYALSSGLSGDSDDIFVCTASALGATTACTDSLFWDGDTTAFAGERIDGIGMGAAFPASVGVDTPAAPSLIEDKSEVEQPEVFDESQDEDELDGDEEAETSSAHTIHLPLVNR